MRSETVLYSEIWAGDAAHHVTVKHPTKTSLNGLCPTTISAFGLSLQQFKINVSNLEITSEAQNVNLIAFNI